MTQERITLRMARIFAGMSQGEVAEKVGVSLATYSYVEQYSGESADWIRRDLSEVFGLSVGDIIWDRLS